MAAAVALVAIAYFAYSLFRPLTPREVCERLEATESFAKAREYLTARFAPAVQAMMALPDTGGDGSTQLTDDYPAPVHVGGCFVGVRMVFRDDSGRPEEIEGVYHLVRGDCGWHVDDLLILAGDGVRLEQPVSLALNYRLLLGTSDAAAVATIKLPTPASNNTTRAATSWWDQRSNRSLAFVAAHGLSKGSMGKWLVGLLAMVGGALGFCGRSKVQVVSPGNTQLAG